METRQTIFVDQFYEMDPQFEDLLPDGTYLRDGMIILTDTASLRRHIYDNMCPHDLYHARITNRWATVSNVQLCDDRVMFVAIYADGVKKKRIYSVEHGWIVKIDSLSTEDNDKRISLFD